MGFYIRYYIITRSGCSEDQKMKIRKERKAEKTLQQTAEVGIRIQGYWKRSVHGKNTFYITSARNLMFSTGQ